MGIFHRNPSVLSLLLLLLFVSYGSGQQENAGPDRVYLTVADPGSLLIMVIFIALFVMVIASTFCCRYGGPYPPVEGGVTRTRRGVARGLNAQAIESFPTFLYSEVKGVRIGKGGTECAVCLNEFEDDETLRLMPTCCHVFHADCIDVWLSFHSTCPVCRSDLDPKPDEDFTHLILEPDTVHETRVPESTDVIDRVTLTDTNAPPRSKSTGFSSWGFTRILFPRSHSTGHSLVQSDENLDRFTLRLSEEVHKHMMQRTSMFNRTTTNVALPQARSSRRGYRSGSVGNTYSFDRDRYRYRYRRAFSMSLSFSFRFRSGSVRSSSGGGDAVAPPMDPQESGERSFEKRLRPDDRV